MLAMASSAPSCYEIRTNPIKLSFLVDAGFTRRKEAIGRLGAPDMDGGVFGIRNTNEANKFLRKSQVQGLPRFDMIPQLCYGGKRCYRREKACVPSAKNSA